MSPPSNAESCKVERQRPLWEESRSGRFTIVTSDYLIQELLRNPKPDHRANTLAMTEYAGLHVPLMESVASRASQIESLAITGFDALHIAAAESAGCDYLVTTDDRLLKKSQRHPSQLMVTHLNPNNSTRLRAECPHRGAGILPVAFLQNEIISSTGQNKGEVRCSNIDG